MRTNRQNILFSLFSAVVVICVIAALNGCGLGYLGVSDDGAVDFRIENASGEMVEVSILVKVPESKGSTAGTGLTTTAQSKPAGMESMGKPVAQRILLPANGIIRVEAGGISSGRMVCGDMVTVSAAVGTARNPVRFSGHGTGTVGFDSGSMGAVGERHLIHSIDFDCADTIIVRAMAAGEGEIVVVRGGDDLPEPVLSDTGVWEQDEYENETGGGGDGVSSAGATDGTDPGAASSAKVTVRLENATATAVDIVLTPRQAVDQSDPASAPVAPTSVRVLPSQFSSGAIACGVDYMVSAAVQRMGTPSVLFMGRGTGTPGFDEASVGVNGERYLQFGADYRCGETVVVRVADDGSDLGSSAGGTPSGTVHVFEDGDILPEPDLPALSDITTVPQIEVQTVTMRIVNTTASVVQINAALGNGTLYSSKGADVVKEFDVRLQAGGTTVGTVPCAQEFMIAATHLQPVETFFTGGDFFGGELSTNYHQVILTGAGTGTDGFDEGAIAVTRGRLLKLGTHFACNDEIQITIAATNNVSFMGENGPVGTVYGIGEGVISVLVQP